MRHQKKAPVFLLLLAALVFSGCGTQNLRYNNPDGTVTSIEYRSAAPFERAPYFETHGDTLKMSFNGNICYEVSVIGPGIREWVEEGALLSESENVRVYAANPHAGYDYAYLFTPAGTDSSCILFYTDGAPGTGSYETDFFTSIRYFVDGQESVPDLNFH